MNAFPGALLHLTASLSTGGGGVQAAVLGLTNSLTGKSAGLEVWGIEGKDEDPLREGFGAKTRTFHRVSFPGMGLAPGMLPALLSTRHSLLHLHGIWNFASLAASFWDPRKPKVVSPHGMLEPWIVGRSPWKKKSALWLWERRNLEACSCIHALTESEYRSIRELGFRRPVAVIPNGVDLPSFRNSSPKSKEKTLLYIGRIHPKKNLPGLISAWRNLPEEKRRGWCLVLHGWGDPADIREVFQNLPPDTHWGGPVFGKRKEAAFRSASAFILPSYSEGLPMAALEAMSYGLPLMMSVECNLPQAFEADAAIETGTSEEKIGGAIGKLMGMPAAQVRAMGERGRRMVEKSYTWDGVADRMAALYRWLLEGGRTPSFVRLD